jgi:hypothetical protein
MQSKTSSVLLALLSVSLVGMPGPRSAVERPRKQGLIVTAVPVRYDALAPLANLTFGTQIEVLIIRVQKLITGREPSKYLKVVYQHLHGQPDLPREIYERQSLWRLALTKASKDDVSCNGPLSELTPTPGTQPEQLPDDAGVPCYVLRPGQLQKVDP